MLSHLLVALVPHLPFALARQDPTPAEIEAADDAARVARCEAWADELILAVYGEDYDELCRLVDVDRWVAKATRDFDAKDAFVIGFKIGAKKTECSGGGFLGGIGTAGGEALRLDLLRIRGDDEHPTALFRAVNTDETFGYYEFSLDVTADSVRASDVETLATGDLISETYRRLLLPLVRQKKAGLLDRLLGDGDSVLKNWKKLEDVIDAATKKECDRLEKLVAALPDDLRYEKFVILMQIAAYEAEDPRYARSIDELMKKHPRDPATRIHAIDYHWLRAEHEKAISSIASLDESLGGDPYLDSLTAGLWLSVEQHDKAVASARKSIDRGLGWVDPYYILIGSSLTRKRHADTLAVLVEMDGEFDLEWNDFKEVAEYAEFAASPEHDKWLAHLAAKPKPESKD